jgi:ATP synthase subunit 6
MISDTAGSKAKPYFAFIFSLFMFVLFCNMFGMIPYTFTVTSHIIVTFILASFIFIGVTIIGFMKHGIGYLKLFVPSGVPAILLPLIVVIEIISYLSRPISLSVRLFANMMAGHYDESFRWLCNKSRNSWWMASTEFFGCVNWFGDLSCFSSSICFCNLNLHLFK